MRTLIFAFLYSLQVGASFGQDPFMDMAVGKIYPSDCPKQVVAQEDDEEDESEGYAAHDYQMEPTHYSWKKLYLKRKGPKVVLDPYAVEYPEDGYFY